MIKKRELHRKDACMEKGYPEDGEEDQALRRETQALRRETRALRRETQALRRETQASRRETQALRLYGPGHYFVSLILSAETF